MKLFRWATTVVALAAVCAVAALVSSVATHGGTAAADAAGPCQLGTKAGQVKHVIYLQFDNTHYRRDNPSVASDLEQMPHLLNFLKGNGTLLTNDHTILISHTAGGILSSLTGLYPDRTGMTVSNSYDYFKSNGDSAVHDVVQVLDEHRGRDERLAAEHGRRRRPDGSGAVAHVHAGRLQRRRRIGGEHRAGEQLGLARRATSRRSSARLRPRRPSRPRCGRPTSSASRSTAPRGMPCATRTRTRSPTTPRRSLAPTTATRPSSAPSTSTRRSPAASRASRRPTARTSPTAQATAASPASTGRSPRTRSARSRRCRRTACR